MCLHGALCSIPFNLICNISFKNVLAFWPNPRGRGCVQGQNMCLHGALCSIPFNLICNMSIFRKKVDLLTPSFDAHKGLANKGQKTIQIHKRSTALEQSVNFFTGVLKPVLRCTNLTLSSDADQETKMFGLHLSSLWVFFQMLKGS